MTFPRFDYHYTLKWVLITSYSRQELPAAKSHDNIGKER